ncbi:MAG: mechanosensitive ion channel family protein [Mangrovibacterium sp.]
MNSIFRYLLSALLLLHFGSAFALDAKTDSLAQAPYPVAQISNETENTQRFVRNVNAQFNSKESVALLDSTRLAEISKVSKISEHFAGDKFDKLEARQTENLQGMLRKEYEELNKMRQAMGERTSQIDNQLTQGQLQRSRWKTTLNTDAKNLPPSIITRIKKNIELLDSIISQLNEQSNSLLYHQDELTNAILLIEELQTKVKQKLDNYRTQIYDSNNLPIWKIHTLSSDSISASENIKTSLRSKKYSLKAYRDTYSHLLLFWLVSFLLLAALFLRIRHNFSKKAAAGETKNENDTPYPIITAGFLSTLLTMMNYPNAPSLIQSILQLTLIVPTLTLIPALWTRLPFKYFVFAIFTVAIAVATDTFNDLAVVNRLLMLANSILLISMYSTLLGWLRNHDRHHRSIPLNFTMLWVGMGAIVLSLISNILGNTYLMSVFFSGSITAVFGGVLVYSVRRLVYNNIVLMVEDQVLGKMNIFENQSEIILTHAKKIIKALSVFLWCVLVAKSFVVFNPIYDALLKLLNNSWELGSMSISLGNIAAFVITFLLAMYLSKLIRFVLEGEVFPRTNTSRGVAGAVLMLVRLTLVAVGIILAMGAADIDVSNITIIFGALGVGIGFGLQTIFNNLASGIILAFERPIKAGDMIQIHSLNLWGEVKEIGIRASTITTFDGADVIVPNGNLLANELINWTHSNHRRRQEILIGVAYGTDLDRAKDILTEVISNQVGVMKNPEPYVVFTGFGDSSLDFCIRFWTHFNDGLTVKSAAGIAIDNAFKQAGIEIPFPQRDLHIIQKGDSSLNVKQSL